MNARAPAPLKVLNETIPAAVLDAVQRADRFSPMLAGQAMIRTGPDEGVLLVRTAAAEIEVTAPQPLLDAVFALCDGNRTTDEVLAQAPASVQDELPSFLGFLVERGALIDGNLACAAAVRYGFQFSPFGLAAPAPVTLQLCSRFLWNAEGAADDWPAGTAEVGTVPLDEFLQARVTQYTFDDRTIDADTLHRLLWSAAGVVSVRHPRVQHTMPQRTIASAGGMHLLQLYVALRRAVGGYTRGVYRVLYPGERRVALQRLGSEEPLLPLAFSKPWQLTYAVGALFVAADPVIGAMRYRNRSLQYLFMEAGAALHNVALTAPALGLAQATIGGYCEEPAARLCGLDRELVLGACIFGAQPTAEQLAALARSPDLDFAWVNGDSPRFSMGFHMARAKVNTPDDQRPHTWGRGTDPWMAMRKAVAEAIEREGYRQPRRVVRATMGELPGAVDPQRCAAYTDAQLARPGFPFHRVDPALPRAWARGTDLASGQPAWVPAEMVYSRSSLADAGFAVERPCTQVTSSGCAAGVDAADATHRALREVIERDAFMRHWLAQRPGRVIAPACWPEALRARALAIEATGCTVVLQQLESPWLPVALLAVQHEAEHFTTLGLAAADALDDAAAGAMDEAEARVYAWLHGHRPTIATPHEVQTSEHHFELYGLERHFRRADRVLFPSHADLQPRWPAHRAPRSLPALVAALAAEGRPPIALDITPDRNAIDQGRTPLAVAKVIVPGLVPVWFGHGLEPLGLVSRVAPEALFPHPFP